MNIAQSRSQLIFFSTIFLVVSILSFFIFKPFLIVLALAAMLAVILDPVYRHLLSYVRGQKNIAAVLVLLFLLVVILLPLFFIGTQIVNEAQALYGRLASGSGSDQYVNQISTLIETYGQKVYPSFSFDTASYLSIFSSWIVSHLGGIFSGTLDAIIKLFLTFVALFYFLRDGDVFRKQLVVMSPLSEDDDSSILSSLRVAIKSVIVGSLIIGVIQGVLLGIGFWIFGIPNATLWGTTAAVASLIPGVGTALVWIPGVIYLFFAKSGFYWLGELLWAVFLVGTIDNFLAPYLLEKGVNIHPLLILFSILGGLSFFGPAGFLLGPLVLSLLFALIRVYQNSTKKESVS